MALNRVQSEIQKDLLNSKLALNSKQELNSKLALNSNLETLDPFAAAEEVMQYDQPNPFFVPAESSKLKYVKTKFLASEYKYVYVLCLKNDFEVTTQNINLINLFHDPESDISELNGQSKLITMMKGSFSLLRLHSIRSGLIEIGKEYLTMFNHEDYELNKKELVYLMLESRENHVKSWLSLYDSNTNLDKFIEQKIFSSYYKLKDKKLDNNMIDLISQVSDFSYWQDEQNCSLSINKAFIDRKFNLSFSQKWNLPTDEIEKELQKLLKDFKKVKETTKIVNTKTNYPDQVTNANATETKISTYNNNNVQVSQTTQDPLKINMKMYTDASKTDYKSFFSLANPDELMIKKESIEELLTKSSLSEKEKYFLICNLLASKNYCHFVLNNYKILTANQELIEKYKPIIKYLIGYSWISLYKEESIRKTRSCQNDRFVFDIDTASKLPVFPFSAGSPHMNPYFSCMVSESLLNCNQNISGVMQQEEYQNGIVDLTEFKRRLNIFISGSANKNLLEGANWSNMVVTGGAMAAIIPKTNPLMSLFKKISDTKVAMTDNELLRFYQEYYSGSDIDIACNHPNVMDFIEHVKHLKSIICKNLGPSVKESSVHINPIKTLAICISAKFLKEKCDKGEIPFTYEYIIAHKNKRVVKFYFYELYLERKKISNEKNRSVLGEKINEDEYFEIIDYCEFDKITLIINNYEFENDVIEYRTPELNSGIEMIYYMKNDNKIPSIKIEDLDMQQNSENNDDNDNNDNDNIEMDSDYDGNINRKKSTTPNIFIKFSETLKYKITSKHMKHCFEVFRISDQEFFSCVARFHLPCVRSYYNGTNCYMLPSAITAYQTLTNIDFKYFIGSHDPISIIDKYRKRGYGTILNKVEINHYLSYIMAMDKYKRAYNVSTTADVKNIVGSIDVNHEFFKPRKYLTDEFEFDASIKLDYTNPKMTSIKSKDDIIKIYKKKYPKYSSEFIEKQTIGSNGQIEPLKKWMIDASYDLLK